MSGLSFRAPGQLTVKSFNYLEALASNGWPTGDIELLKSDLLRFESVSIQDDYDEALEAMIYTHHEAHTTFLKKLNRHIKAITRAARYEELQIKATGSGRDSIAANVIMNRRNGVAPDLSSLKNKDVRLQKLGAMTKAELQQEIEETKKRLGTHV